MSIAVLILAAGASTRMKGKIKQLLPWGSSTLLGHAIEQAKTVSDHCHVVLGSNLDIIARQVPSHIKIVYNPNWQSGLGSSISTGVSSIKEQEDLQGVLIMLADQPFLDAPFLKEMKETFIQERYTIVATSYGDKLGVPAIFDKTLFPELLMLNKDFGAQQIILEQQKYAVGIESNGRQVDIDTMEKYNQLIENK
ncbi:nucleotidyltransferase family protein [Flagellimonas meishanensis]|uniref:nucleotidyltransferase family protein n=1 Tax=Flagellimonas meishanensis TaxID=2873264 RepID=UPI001CA63629|nr:nucleotidyltransferase family protein [[Muricauda] meishanensis]